MKLHHTDAPSATANRWPAARWLAKQRGSAMILTLLILLVLSALGMTAMREVSRSVQQSGAYRVRAQANGLSEAAVNYTLYQAGQDASMFWTMMNTPQTTRMTQLSDLDARSAQVRRGAFLKLEQKVGDTSPAFPELYNTKETGLLTSSDGSYESFEVASNGAQFSVVLRDPIDGPPAPGYGDRYCFKKVTIASRAVLGEPSPDWSGSGMVADKRNAVETYIGPIECGAQ